jgi:uncharacterized LabA/DUF88 family protein
MDKAQHKEQKVAVFIDVQNLYYSGRNLYNAKVNFNAILRKAVAGRKLIRAFAYVIKTEAGDEKYFFDALKEMGIEIRAKDLQIFHGGHKKGDWDVGLAMDVVRMTSKIDCVLLVSGDGDYKDLLDYARAVGCRTEAISFGRSSSIHLKQTADLFVDLDKDNKKYLMGTYRPRPNDKSTPTGTTVSVAPKLGASQPTRTVAKPVPAKPAVRSVTPTRTVAKPVPAKPVAKPVAKPITKPAVKK